MRKNIELGEAQRAQLFALLPFGRTGLRMGDTGIPSAPEEASLNQSSAEESTKGSHVDASN
jgi:hypothetical protein